MWRVKKEVLFERTLPEARCSAHRYQPQVAKAKAKREWKLKSKA